MQAITTKYHGPTNHRGSRVIASCEAGRHIHPWDHALNSEANHRAAAMALVVKLGWNGKWRGGSLPDGKGHAFVCINQDAGFDVQ